MKDDKKIKAKFDRLVRIDHHVRSLNDGRRIVDRYLVLYIAGDNEYRRSFETKRDVPVEIPETIMVLP